MDLGDSLSSICVNWKTEKPIMGGWRRTPFFHLRQNELCLELALEYESAVKAIMTLRIVWRRKPSSLKQLHTCSYIQIGKRIYRDNITHNPLDNKLVVGILYYLEEIPFYSSETEWTVLCKLSCDQPFNDQVNKKIVHLSTVDDLISPDMLVYNEYGQGSSVNPRDMEALSCDFSRMLKDEIIPDFKLKCEGRIFPVHKNVLAARSKVFHAMFRNDMLESKTDSVDIKDLRVSILDLFLKFVYSGKLEDITVDTVADLYVAADRYSVRSLMSACSHYMIKNVSVENCLRYLKTADMLSDADLKAALASFVLKHPDVFKSAAWKSFSEQHPLLAKKILINCASSAQP